MLTEVAKRPHTYLSTTDLADRWGYSSRWVRELVAARDFPDPAFAVSRGLIPIWSLDDVEAWESRNDPTVKHNRRLAAQQPSSPRRRRSSYTPPLGATYEQRVAFIVSSSGNAAYARKPEHAASKRALADFFHIPVARELYAGAIAGRLPDHPEAQEDRKHRVSSVKPGDSATDRKSSGHA